MNGRCLLLLITIIGITIINITITVDDRLAGTCNCRGRSGGCGWDTGRLLRRRWLVIVEPLRLLKGHGSLEHWTLQVVGRDIEVAARLRLQVPVVHLHVDDSHKFNLSSELLNFFLEASE